MEKPVTSNTLQDGTWDKNKNNTDWKKNTEITRKKIHHCLKTWDHSFKFPMFCNPHGDGNLWINNLEFCNSECISIPWRLMKKILDKRKNMDRILLLPVLIRNFHKGAV